MFTITPAGNGMGAQVIGVDRRVVPDDRTYAQLQAALDEHLVLIFRDPSPPPSDEQLIAFCRRFGPLRPSLADRSRVPDHPDINLVGNQKVGNIEASGGSGALHFHSDLHHEPPLIEFIYLDAVAVPDQGGDTIWVDLRRAYDDLPEVRRAELDSLVVHYGLRQDLDRQTYFKASNEVLATRRQSTDVSLVQTNGRSGRRSLWANTGPQSNHAAQVVGMDPADSDQLLLELFEHCTKPDYQYRHIWQAGDACLWHNLQTLHGRDAFAVDQRRLMRHVNILGIRDPHQT